MGIGTVLRGIVSGDSYGYGGITFMRSVVSVKIELAARLEAIKVHRAAKYDALLKGLKEEKKKPVDPEAVLSAVRRVPYHAHTRGMSERVQKLLKTATTVVRADETIEALGFVVEQLGQEVPETRLLELSLGEMVVIFRPFDADEFDESCCGHMIGIGSPAVTSLSSFVGASNGLGQIDPGVIDSIGDALSGSDVIGDLGA